MQSQRTGRTRKLPERTRFLASVSFYLGVSPSSRADYMSQVCCHLQWWLPWNWLSARLAKANDFHLHSNNKQEEDNFKEIYSYRITIKWVRRKLMECTIVECLFKTCRIHVSFKKKLIHLACLIQVLDISCCSERKRLQARTWSSQWRTNEGNLIFLSLTDAGPNLRTCMANGLYRYSQLVLWQVLLAMTYRIYFYWLRRDWISCFTQLNKTFHFRF